MNIKKNTQWTRENQRKKNWKNFGEGEEIGTCNLC